MSRLKMTGEVTEQKEILRGLGNGLILRRSTPADTEALVDFNAEIHKDQETEEPEEFVAAWTRDLMRGDHPTFGLGDFTIVEEVNARTIVSVSNLISQTWSYDSIEFGVGRPELVGTHPDYRRRGLVRAQFEVLHEWSAERGERLQAITGIPWFYRQFGYEMGLSLGGGRLGYKPHVPKLEDDEKEPYRVRPASESDLDFIAEVYAHGMQRYRVACVRDEVMWRYELLGKSAESINRLELRVIESTAGGESVGVLVQPPRLWGPTSGVTLYELKPGVSWAAATPSVVRYLWQSGEKMAEQEEDKELGAFGFWLGEDHPAYRVIPDALPRKHDPYAWYVRIPDVPDFLRHVAPALERRLAKSVAAGHTDELKISFYREGVKLILDGGKIAEVELWQPPRAEAGDAVFPDLTFLQLLFGYRSLDELEYAFADCWVKDDESRAVVNALFPRQPSDVWPVS